MSARQSEKNSSSGRQILKFAIKVLISAAALYFVFRKVDFAKSLDAIRNTHLGWFILAAIWFNLVKILGVLRLKFMVRPLGIDLPFGWNVKLYFIGAFYNLFLPGSIGGDGYKVYLLKQRYGESATRKLVSAILLDRASGMAALFVLTCGMVLLASYQPDWPWLRPMVIAGMVICYPAYYVVLSLFFSDFRPEFWNFSAISFLTQLGMVAFAWFLLRSLGIENDIFTYIVIFMVASVISIVPFTLGGLGARESVFAFAATFAPVDEAKGVALALLVFTVLAFSSFIGMVLNFVGKD